MCLFQAPGQLSGPCGVCAPAAGGVSCSAGGTFPPEEDPTGCLLAASHPAPVHAGGSLFMFLYFLILSIHYTSLDTFLEPPSTVSRFDSLCVCFAGNRGNGCLEAGSPETVPGLLRRKDRIAKASRCQPGQASAGQASIGTVTASGG